MGIPAAAARLWCPLFSMTSGAGPLDFPLSPDRNIVRKLFVHDVTGHVEVEVFDSVADKLFSHRDSFNVFSRENLA